MSIKILKYIQQKYLSMLLLASVMTSCTYDKAVPIDPNVANVSYSKDVLPILITHCYVCHTDTARNPDRPRYAFFNDFNELKRFATKKSGTDPNYTTLQARIRHVETPGMPLERPMLPEDEIKTIENWIKAGAPNN